MAAEHENPVRVSRHGGEDSRQPTVPSRAPACVRALAGGRALQASRSGGRGCTSVRTRRGRETTRFRRRAPSRGVRCGGRRAAAEQRCRDEAADRERGREEPEAAEPEAEMGDGPCDEEVERSAATVVRHVLDDAAERVPADEERERLVLVRRPRHQLDARRTSLRRRRPRSRRAGTSAPRACLDRDDA